MIASFEIDIKGLKTSVTTSKELKEILKQIKKDAENIDFGNAELQDFNKNIAKLTAEQKNARAEARKLVQEQIAQEKSYRGLSAQLTVARNKVKDYAAEQIKLGRSFDDIKRNDDVYDKMARGVRELDAEVKELDKDLGQTFRNVGNYEAAFTDAFNSIRSQIPGLTGELAGVVSAAAQGISTAGNLGIIPNIDVGKFINPLTIGLTAIAGLTTRAINNVVDVTREYEKLFSTLAKQTGLVGAELVENTARLKAFADTVDREFQELVTVANATAQGFGVPFSEALDSIERGILSLGTLEAQDEFLDTFREYPILIADAGFSLEEFTNLAVLSSRSGIFSDKAIDSIKEAQIALGEFTKAQEDALVGALGQQFSDNLQKRIRTAEISTKDAILEIGDALEEAGADVQDYATITADVFKGAGEDAGGFVQILDLVRGATQELLIPADAYTRRLQDQLDASRELEDENARIASSLAGLGTSFDALGTRLQALGQRIIADVIGSFQLVRKQIEANGGGFGGFLGSLNDTDDEIAALKKSIKEANETALAEVQKGQANREQLEKTVEQKRLAAQRAAARQRAKAEKEAAEGSIDALKEQLTKLNDLFGEASTDSARSGISTKIEEISNQIDILKNKAAGTREILSFGEIQSGTEANGITDELGTNQTDVVSNEEKTRIDLERQTNQELLSLRNEYLEEEEKIETEAAERRAEAIQEITDRLAQTQIDSLEDLKDAGLAILFDELQARLQAAAVQAFANAFAANPVVGAVVGGVAAGVINGLIGRLRSILIGADGLQVDRDGNVIGPRHSQGGVWTNINGRAANIEGGENYQVGERGVVSVINRKSSQKYAGLLSAISGRVFEGKNDLLRMINGGFSADDMRKPFAFSMAGNQFAPSAPSGFAKTELSEESIENIRLAVRTGAEQGTQEGSSRGFEEASEKSRKLSLLNQQTTF